MDVFYQLERATTEAVGYCYTVDDKARRCGVGIF